MAFEVNRTRFRSLVRPIFYIRRSTISDASFAINESVTSNARAFFEFIKKQPNAYQYLLSIPDPDADHHPFFEEEWLDFKGCPSDNKFASKIDDKGAKKIWSKALSGYANITDGLIIWGIDARKAKPRDIDAACGLRLIPNPDVFESKLRDWIRDATNPPVMGVEYLAVPGPDGPGFVVCFIPESRHRPHRAEVADKHYYYRAGDDFLIADPGLLRTLFYPHIRPRLRVVVMLGSQAYGSEVDDLKVAVTARIFVLNDGTHSANNLCVVLDHDQEVHPESEAGAGWDFLGLVTQQFAFDRGQQSLHKFAFASERPLQPGFQSLAGLITWEFDVLKGHIEMEDDQCRLALPIELTAEVFADDIEPGKGRARFEGDELILRDELQTKLFMRND